MYHSLCICHKVHNLGVWERLLLSKNRCRWQLPKWSYSYFVQHATLCSVSMQQMCRYGLSQSALLFAWLPYQYNMMNAKKYKTSNCVEEFSKYLCIVSEVMVAEKIQGPWAKTVRQGPMQAKRPENVQILRN